MKCFYHDDMDGRLAAYSVRRKWSLDHFDWVPADFVPCQYGQAFPLGLIDKGEAVWIVDFSIEPDVMRLLLARASEVVWIDHHKTAIEKYEGFQDVVAGVRKDGIAACELTWTYCFPREAMPRAVRLVGDRDAWRWAYGDEARWFHAGLCLHDTSPASDFWLPPSCDEIVAEGKIVETYRRQFYNELAGGIGYSVEFEGHKCWAINAARVSSDLFPRYMEQYAVILPHYCDRSGWSVSMYSNDIDVSEIAKRYGGGGHKKAAGFPCKELPWRRDCDKDSPVEISMA